MPLLVTGLFAAVNTMLLLFLSFQVIKSRRRARVSIGSGGDQRLAEAVRAHGNAAETIPICLILMGLCEGSAAPLWFVALLGVLLTVGRVAHAWCFLTNPLRLTLRAVGMASTFVTMGLASLWLLWAVLWAVVAALT